MAFWKSTAADLSALLKREAPQQPRTQSSRTDENIVFESLCSSPEASTDATSSLSPNVAREVNSMTRSVLTNIPRDVGESKESGTTGNFSAAIDRVTTKETANVAEEICKKELITMLEKSLASHDRMGRTEEDFEGGEEANTILLKRRVTEMSNEVRIAKETLRVSTKKKYELERVCEELEGKSSELSRALREARSHIQQLQTESSSLKSTLQEVKAEKEQLQEETRVEKAGELRAFHKAEMAKLVAKQASLQNNRFNGQLRRNERQVQVQELDRVLDEMTSALTNLVSCTEQKRRRTIVAQAKLLARKSCKFLGRFGVPLSRNKKEPDRGGGYDREMHVETTVEDENANLAELRPPDSSNGWPLGMTSDNSNRNRHQNPPGLFRKIAGFLRHDKFRVQNDTHDSQARWIDRFPSGGYGVFAEEEYDGEGGQSAKSKLATAIRILSRGIRTKIRRQFQRNGPRVAEVTSTAAEAMEKNLRAMQEMLQSNEHVIQGLQVELGNFIKRSDAFEQGMMSERQKRFELEENIASTGRQSSVSKTDMKESFHYILHRHSSLREKVSMRWSCRWF